MKQSLEYYGDLVGLKSKLNEQMGRCFHLEWINENEFKFLAIESSGTAIVNNNPGFMDGIRGYAKIGEEKNRNVSIELSTKLRIELKIIVGFGIIWTIYSIYLFKLIPILLIALFPLIFGRAYKFYRKQELDLFENIKNHLKNKPVQ